MGRKEAQAFGPAQRHLETATSQLKWRGLYAQGRLIPVLPAFQLTLAAAAAAAAHCSSRVTACAWLISRAAG